MSYVQRRHRITSANDFERNTTHLSTFYQCTEDHRYSTYVSSEKQNNMVDAKAPAKTKNCVFRLINILFSDVMSPKFVQLGEKKDKNILDSGLAANDEYFWHEVVEQYQQTMFVMTVLHLLTPCFLVLIHQSS
jgi:hypothetical protein